MSTPVTSDDMFRRLLLEQLMRDELAFRARSQAGKTPPLFKVGDKVRIISDDDTVPDGIGEVAIVDAYGTFEQQVEPSYDIWFTQSDGTRILCKHFVQSLLESAVENIDTDGVDGVE